MKQKARDDFNMMLDGMKMSDGKLSYNKSYKYEDSGVVVWLSPEAYKKIVMYRHACVPYIIQNPADKRVIPKGKIRVCRFPAADYSVLFLVFARRGYALRVQYYSDF